MSLAGAGRGHQHRPRESPDMLHRYDLRRRAVPHLGAAARTRPSRTRAAVLAATASLVLLAVAGVPAGSPAGAASGHSHHHGHGHAARGFVQTNLVSDIDGMAQLTDPALKNPWGLAFG